MSTEIEREISELAHDVRLYILNTVYNWNWTHIPELEREMKRSTIRNNNIDGTNNSFNDLIYRLDWWIHLFKQEPKNPRLVTEIWRLIHRFRAIREYQLADILTQIANYNF